MPRIAAGALVFLASAAVLMLEILAGRLLAPYVGISLETYTGIIGVVLAGISLGAWGGGWLADRVDPRRTLGPILMLGGALALLAVPTVRLLGEAGTEDRTSMVLVLSVAGFFPSAAVLSAVTPTVIKLQLRSLEETGRVVGRLSAIGTAGAICGTFVTGFVLISALPTRPTILVMGAALVVLGAAVWLWLGRRAEPAAAALLALAIACGVAGARSDPGPCQWESPYACGRVVADPFTTYGRTLWLDTLQHSYVDLRNPRSLRFEYVRTIRDAIDAAHPGRGPLAALHVGGGGFTLPRYVAATRPGSRNLILEIDSALVREARRRLGLVTGPGLRVREGDARLGIRREADDAYDVVVGDAFAGLSIPWHLTTREFVGEVRRVLRPDGLYALNVIDSPPLGFLRAELATLGDVFRHVAVLAPPYALDPGAESHFVLLASDRPLPLAAMLERARDGGDLTAVRTGRSLRALVGGARVLTDDYAPVDQLINID